VQDNKTRLLFFTSFQNAGLLNFLLFQAKNAPGDTFSSGAFFFSVFFSVFSSVFRLADS